MQLTLVCCRFSSFVLCDVIVTDRIRKANTGIVHSVVQKLFLLHMSNKGEISHGEHTYGEIWHAGADLRVRFILQKFCKT